jgi:hypothetical protein
VWARSNEGAYAEKLNIKSHTDEVTAIAMHPTQHYALTAARDGRWGVHAFDTHA